MNPVVSVIVPVYNAEKYIEVCSRSLLEQTLRDIEYIFVDDCSTDNSMMILQNVIDDYPERKDNIKIIRQEKNQGACAARTKGFEHSTGDFIIYCDADDWVDKEMYGIMYDTAKANNADVVSCDYYMVYSDHSTILCAPRWGNNQEENLRTYLKSNGAIHTNLLISRNVYNRLLEDDSSAISRCSDLGITLCEDYNINARLMYFAEKIVGEEKPLYYYNRMNEDSITRTITFDNVDDELKSYIDIAQWMRDHGKYDLYRKEICWRILKAKKIILMDKSTYKIFVETYPESNQFILSCPILSKKQKIMMWIFCKNMGHPQMSVAEAWP